MNCPHCGKPISFEPQLLDITAGDLVRLFSHVKKSETCWICDLNPSGVYARIGINGRNYLAHVVSYIAHFGPVPDGKKVCHTCDTPRCVRPDHLQAKSHSENMTDMVNGKRHKPRFGLANNLGKLSDKQVTEIRSSTDTTRFLVSKFGVSFQCIWRIRKGLQH